METVLVVEDDPMVRNITLRWLARAGYRALVATRADEAVTTALASRPDIILMDIGLPDASGFQAIRRIRALPTVEDTPIIVVTAFASAEDRYQAFEAGGDAYETKPVEFRRLLETIRALLDARRPISSSPDED
jgi:DNA-binding response OmpR family regulator